MSNNQKEGHGQRQGDSRIRRRLGRHRERGANRESQLSAGLDLLRPRIGRYRQACRGVYCLPEVFNDEFAAISYRWTKCVLSHGSALYLAGLSDRTPAAIDVAVPRSYNPRGLSQEYLDTKIHRLSLPSSTSSVSRKSSGCIWRCSHDEERCKPQGQN